MATDEPPFCTDEELLLELKKLGYSDVTADAFLMVKKDLSELVLKERSVPKNSLKYQQRYKNSKYSSPPTKEIKPTTFLPERSPTFVIDTKLKTPLGYSSPSSYIPDVSPNKYNSNERTQSQNLSGEEATENSDDTPISNESPDTSITSMSFGKYRERLKTFKAGRQPNSPNKESSSSVSLEGNRIKRKVLRHKNGKPVITEEYIEIPSIFNTPTSDVTPKSISSDDLSFKTNSSSGSLSAASPETSDTPRSTDSMSSSRSVLGRVSMPRKKKSDPVAMYNFYKKFWNEYKPPGEKKHEKLRWAVRDRMLDYSL